METEHRAGDRLCSCKLLCRCGVGACGEVWLAEDAVGARVALKILSGRYSELELAGLRNSRDCNHPNLLKIRHVEIADGLIRYTMDAADDLNSGSEDYLPDTLANRLRRFGRLTGREIAAMLDGLLAGLEELHGRGLVHRDIKPDNILWVSGRATLSDVGLIAPAGKHSLVGTPGFVSPRLLTNGGVAGPEDDLYALSKAVYCALTGLPVSAYPEIPADMTISMDPRLNRALLAGCSGAVASVAEFRRIVAGAAPPPANPAPAGARSFPAKLTAIAAAAIVAVGLLWLVRSGHRRAGEASPAPAMEVPAPAPFAAAAGPTDRKAEFLRDRNARAQTWFRRFGMLNGGYFPELLAHRVFTRESIEPEVERLLKLHFGTETGRHIFDLRGVVFFSPLWKDPDASRIRARQEHWRRQPGRPADVAGRMLTEDPVMQLAAVNLLLERFCRLALDKRDFAGQVRENVENLIELQHDFVAPEFGLVLYASGVRNFKR